MRQKGGELAGLRVLLTGATGGLGRAMAARLARAGAELVLTGRRSRLLEELAAELGARSLVGDVTDREFVRSLPARLSEAWGAAADVLINNAGVFELAPVSQTEPAAFESALAVNLRAPFELIHVLLPDMLERGSGHIVNIGSVAGRKAFPGNAAYSASKYGLRGLHEVLVEELSGTGVRVTWIEPSAIDTPLWDRFDPDGRSDLPARAEMLDAAAVAEAVWFAVAQGAGAVVEEIVIRANSSVGRS